MNPSPGEPKVSERRVVFLVAMNCFVIQLNLSAALVLGPDLTTGLGIPGSRLGLVNGSYTAAAAASSLTAAFLLDRFDRRALLGWTMLGLSCGIMCTGMARGVTSLLFARALCGVFGIIAGSMSFAMIADAVPVERRGRATSAVVSMTSFVTVLGEPAALEISRRFGWSSVFSSTALLGLVAALCTVRLMPKPKLSGHIEATRGAAPFSALRPVIRWAYLLAVMMMVVGQLLGPGLATFLTRNLGCPRKDLAGVYLISGVAGFAVQRAMGPLIDRFGTFAIGTINAAMILIVMWFGFVTPVLSPLALAIGFEVALVARFVPYQTLVSKVAFPTERGRFNAFQSATHMAGATLGAMIGARLLRTLPDEKLAGVPRVALLAMAVAATLPFLLWRVEKLALRERA